MEGLRCHWRNADPGNHRLYEPWCAALLSFSRAFPREEESEKCVWLAGAGITWDGEGQLAIPGPKGALPTLHLENVRDGFEDYELCMLRSMSLFSLATRLIVIHSTKRRIH